MPKKMLEVTALSGDTFNVDISNKACGKFGFKHGDRVVDLDGVKGTVIGVAPCDVKEASSDLALWLRMDSDHELVCFADREWAVTFRKLTS